MSESKLVRITKVLRELNIPLKLAVEFLKSNNHDIKKHPNTKITLEQYSLLFNEFYSDKSNMFETDKGINKKLSENSQNRQKHRVRKELDLNSIKDLKIKANLNFKGKTIKLHELSSKKVKENKFVKVKNDNVEKKWSKKGNRNVNFKEKTIKLNELSSKKVKEKKLAKVKNENVEKKRSKNENRNVKNNKLDYYALLKLKRTFVIKEFNLTELCEYYNVRQSWLLNKLLDHFPEVKMSDKVSIEHLEYIYKNLYDTLRECKDYWEAIDTRNPKTKPNYHKLIYTR